MTFRVFYVGSVSEAKGVVDLIDAVALLRSRGANAALTIAGDGALDRMKRRALEKGIAESVEFLGRVGHDQVGLLMRQHDAVVVPSRSSYAEGLPMTVYEALCSRTPLLVSDHPMLVSALHCGQSGTMVFKEANPASLADALGSLMADPQLYQRLSLASEAAWESIQVPLKWGELIERWINGTAQDIDHLKRHSLEVLDRHD